MASSELDRAVDAWAREDQAALDNRWPMYRALREQASLYRYGTTTLVARYDDVFTVLSNDSFFENGPFAAGGNGLHDVPASLDPVDLARVTDIIEFQSHWMTASNGARHEQLRRFGTRVFSPRAVADLRTTIDAVIDELLSAVAQHEEIDFVDQFAYRLPLAVISEILDIDLEQRDRFHQLWQSMVKALGGVEWRRGLPRDLDEMHESYRDMRRLLQDFIDERRTNGTSSEVLARMFAAQREDPSITDWDLVGILSQLFAAGHQTTQDLLSSGVYTLLTHPSSWEDLKSDPNLIRNAVEEILRLRSPSQAIKRTCVRDVEIGGHPVRRGDTMFCLIGAANLDPAKFDAPEQFDIRRDNAKQHISFGQGAHFCLGAALSRLEGAAALETLARRFPHVELLSDDVTWTGGVGLLGLSSLRLRLGSDHGRS